MTPFDGSFEPGGQLLLLTIAIGNTLARRPTPNDAIARVVVAPHVLDAAWPATSPTTSLISNSVVAGRILTMAWIITI